jgi:2',3'-cyclic-nucleotide 2'-phosphodiesterase (5'-nucleotidase family)/formiminotetrahydrofolate cyclodeaminase
MHTSYRAFSALGVDAASLGNHDFDLGNALLSHAIKQDARFPILAANLTGSADLDNIRFPAAIFVVKGVRIGVIGLVTRAETKLVSSDWRISDPVKAVKNLLPAIKPLCDVLIILSHLGYSLDSKSAPTMDAGDVELAKSLPYGSVHLIIGGHSHDVLNQQELSVENIVNGIPIVQAGAMGRYLGRVIIRVKDRNASVTNAQLLLTSNLPVDLEFEKQEIQPILDEARKLFTKKLGSVANDPGLSTENVINIFAAGELTLANFITDAIVRRMELAGQAVDFSVIDSSCVRRGLDYGEFITFGDWFNLMPFADTIRIFQISGRQLYELLLDNAYRVDRPDEPHTERGFLQFSQQIRYKVILGESRKEVQIYDVSINNIPIENQMEKVFLMAGTSFTRELAVNWETHQKIWSVNVLIDLDKFPFKETDFFLRREMVAYILEHGGVTVAGGARCDGRLSIIEEKQPPISIQTVYHFINEVAHQKHAMAGAVIAISAAEAASLGLACMRISQDQVEVDFENFALNIKELDGIKNALVNWGDKDANAIAEFVRLRDGGDELQGQQLLCDAPTKVAGLSIKAAKILQDFRGYVTSKVKDDLEMSISLLSGTARAALLLLDSNLRIWPETNLVSIYDPILNNLKEEISKIQVAESIRQE